MSDEAVFTSWPYDNPEPAPKGPCSFCDAETDEHYEVLVYKHPNKDLFYVLASRHVWRPMDGGLFGLWYSDYGYGCAVLGSTVKNATEALSVARVLADELGAVLTIHEGVES